MLKLNAGFSRKVGEANYGSRGASVNVELEVESSLVNDPDALTGRIRDLFGLARRAVDDELRNRKPHQDQSGGPDDQRRGHTDNGDRPVRYATTSQVRAIRAIARQKQLDPDRLANDRFRVNSLEELSVREASTLIDELKNGQATNRTGGGR
jgi:hypothetical protein